VQEKTREIDLDSYSDPLAEVLRLKRDTERSMLSDVYEEWSGKWLNFLTNIKDFAKDVAQAPQYSGGGIEVKVNDFGIITFESFCDMYNGHQFKQSWFFSLEIVSRKEKEIYMFHFDKDSEVKTALKLQTRLPISLFISRYVSNEYRRLSTEPVSLRCFRLVDGNVTAFLQAGAMSEQDVTKVINRFVAEVVLDYLIPEGLG
jgi:hypothetical protein